MEYGSWEQYFLGNSIIEAGNIYGTALLLSSSLKLLENFPLRDNKDAFVSFMLLFKDLLPGFGATPNE